MNNDLKKKTIKGLKWTSLNTAFTGLSTPAYQIVLAMLFTPSQFAYIAVIKLLVGFSNLLNDLGLGEAIIQRDKVNNEQISTVFYLNLLLASIIILAVFFTSNIIEQFYEMEDLGYIIKILTVTIFLNGGTSIFRVYLQKNLLFREFSIAQIIKRFSEIVVTLILILLGMGVMAIAIGVVISTAIYALSLIYYAFKKTDIAIKFYFSLRTIYDLLGFGISISLKRILTFSTHRIDEVIIGGLLSSEALGAYYFGKNLVLQLQTLMSSVFAQLLLPIFSRVKNNIDQLRAAYTNFTYYIALLAIPILIGVALSADIFMPLFFGEQWTNSIIVVKIFSLAMIPLVLTANIATSLIYSLNKPNWVLLIDFLTAIVYFGSLFLFSSANILSILVIYSSYITVKTFVLQLLVSKLLNRSILQYVSKLYKIIISTLLMSIIIIYWKEVELVSQETWINLIAIFLIGSISYILMQLIIDKENSKKLITILNKQKI